MYVGDTKQTFFISYFGNVSVYLHVIHGCEQEGKSTIYIFIKQILAVGKAGVILLKG
jgi:hypothetical protein